MAASHVLVPLDGSPLADEALVRALELFDCRITMLNVVTPLDSSMSESGVIDTDTSRRETAHERADELIARAKRRAADEDRSIEATVETGTPAETILAYVDDHDVDHVVMGSHGGPQTLASRLLGTVATTVVSEAPVTVTVVR
ncbi:Nucleotide-binding universal stress protein, UspA family [Halogranum amylolyticum]|uniref:Nucleotide-binding universal stress protein, UspA family n=1 Tax=Halogranum amylolyticum TaxID=660520 RepID=A0A1H8SIZ1_9EURY|nr:universal stress protein [Halogranum amylolyticum]SEO78535.1 Nucleotide-binding universal stress protein, UspA family [Halogranum amylolyticum]